MSDRESKFKIGDLVRIISRDTADSLENEEGEIRINGVQFNDEMYKHCGSLAEIIFAGTDYGYGHGYRVKYINGPYQDWHFLECMLELPKLQDRLIMPTNKFNEELL